MFCKQCGVQNQEGQDLCVNCGKPLTVASSQQAPVSPAEPQIPQYTAPVSPVYETPSSYSVSSEATKKSFNLNMASFTAAIKGIKNVKSIKDVTVPMYILFGVAVLVLVLLICAVTYAFSSSDPKSVAVGFQKAMYEKNWDKAYKYLDAGGSKFTSKAKFVEAAKKYSSDKIEIKKIKATDKEDVTSDYEKLMNNNKKFSKIYNIDLDVTPKDDDDDKKVEDASALIGLKKSRKFFIFSDYVAMPNAIVYDHIIKAPEGSKVTIDGTKINGSKGEYKIKKIFAMASYKLEIEHKDYKKYTVKEYSPNNQEYDAEKLMTDK